MFNYIMNIPEYIKEFIQITQPVHISHPTPRSRRLHHSSASKPVEYSDQYRAPPKPYYPFRDNRHLYIMHLVNCNAHNNNNCKAYSERQKILLNRPILQLNFPHITLLDVHFNSKHYLYNSLNKTFFTKIIREAYNYYLIDTTINHQQNNYDIMGPFWGKTYTLSNHTPIIGFREYIFQNINKLHKKKNIIQIGTKTVNNRIYYFFGLEGESDTRKALYCIPDYHMYNNWKGHISVIKFEIDPTLPTAYFREMALNIKNKELYTIKNIDYKGNKVSISDLFHLYNITTNTIDSVKINKILSDKINTFLEINLPKIIKYNESANIELNIFKVARKKYLPWNDITFKTADQIKINLQGPKNALEVFDIII